MQQIATLWSKLDPKRRMIVVFATLGMFAAVLMLSVMATRPGMSLLYSGLESGPAGEVVRALEQRGAVYEVRGGAIYVENAKRDELRMTLASEGLPAPSSEGYELLDGLSGFGTTAQMFDAAYWRAKEGELARTIASSPRIAAARVHIATNGSNPFQRDVGPSASVSISTPGGTIAASHARALRYLVAAAVPGMTPDNVSVIDGEGTLVGGAEENNTASNNDQRAESMRVRVLRMLEAHVGFGNAVVEVAVETFTDSESITETHIDPDSKVAISTETQEQSNTSKDAAGGDVTVASNLPTGDKSGSGDGSSSQNTQTRERINYEVSETKREVMRVPGALKRLSVAVLVNGATVPDENGDPQFVPRSLEELESLRELVSAAVGFDGERGDVITLKSLSFQPLSESGGFSDSRAGLALNLDYMMLIQIAVLSLVALILGLFVVRPALTRPVKAEQISAPGTADRLPQPETDNDGFAAADAGLPPLTGEIAPDDFELPDLPMFSGEGFNSMSVDEQSDDPVDRLRALIGERKEETVEILRSWLDEKEGQA